MNRLGLFLVALVCQLLCVGCATFFAPNKSTSSEIGKAILELNLDKKESATGRLDGECKAGDNDACFLYFLMTSSRKNIQSQEKQYADLCNKSQPESCYRSGSIALVRDDKPAAKDYFKRACQAGHDMGCGALGILSYRDRTAKKVIGLVETGCKHDAGYSCYALGRIRQDLGALQDAAKFYSISCEHVSMGCTELGHLKAKSSNNLIAKQLYQKACMDGDVTGCRFIELDKLALKSKPVCTKANPDDCEFAGLYDEKNNKHSNALNNFQKGCDFGHAWSCYGAARLLSEQDKYKLAIPLFKKACAQGVGRACIEDVGEKFSPDYSIAEFKVHAAIACQRGDGRSCDLGCLEDDKSTREKSIVRGCELGYVPSCLKQAQMLYYTKRETTKASSILKKLCDNNAFQACGQLGYYHFLESDKTKAAALFNKGCDGGDLNSCVFLSKHTAKPDAKEMAFELCDRMDAYSCAKAAEEKFYTGHIEESTKLFKKSCDLGNINSCLFLKQKNLDPKAELQALHLYRRACYTGRVESCDPYIKLKSKTSRALASPEK